MGRKDALIRNLARPYVISFGIFLTVCSLYMFGLLEFVEFQLIDTQFQINKRLASKSIVLVKIDSKSVRELEIWPWPRSLHATAIDKISTAGAKSIIVDIDFSSRSEEKEDARLLQAFKDAQASIFLPAFKQVPSQTVNQEGAKPVFTSPHSDFLRHVNIASANFIAESDGLIRVQDIIHQFGDNHILTFAAAVTEDKSLPHSSFYIDFGIQPDSVPQISFTDLIYDKYEPAILRGKVVIIGATALELGDIKATPVYRTLSGPEIIALSYESIIQDRMLRLVPLIIEFPILLVVCLLSTSLFARISWKKGLFSWFGLAFFYFAAFTYAHSKTNWLFEMTPILLATMLTFLASIIRQIELQSIRLLLQSVEIRRSDVLMRTVVENSFDGIVITDTAGRIYQANPAAEMIFGYQSETLEGRHLSDLFSENSVAEPMIPFLDGLQNSNKIHELYGMRLSGREFDLETIVRPMIMDDGIKRAIFFRDITVQKEQARLLEHQAYFDSLTGLPNRTLLRDRVDNAIKTANRKNLSFALMLVDLDHFKEINDTLGHAFGDKLLKKVAQRLQESVRDSDTVSRLGGDEFAILFQDVADINVAGSIAQKILDHLNKHFVIKDDTLSSDLTMSVEASIGVVLYPDHGETLGVLLKNADIAMYTSKTDKSGISIYDEHGDKHNMRRLILSGELRSAISANELFLVYQPQIDLVSGELSGFEALMRWKHSKYGMVSPGEFIDMAERSGLIHKLTDLALQQAISQIGIWLKAGLNATMSVNLSMRNLQDEALPQMVEMLLSIHDVPAEKLILEATETVMTTNSKQTIQTLHLLSDMGTKISIDDFGTGHSSLQYIKDMPLSELKIDKSFIINMMSDDRSRSIVEAIVALSKTLHLKIVAEGVEGIEIANELKDLGCQIGQGYYFAQPMKAEEVISWYAREYKTNILSQPDAANF